MSESESLEKSDRRQSIQSVGVSIEILKALADGAGAMTLKEISEKVDMAPAKVHRYLASFVKVGMVERGANEVYAFGPLAVQIGVAAIARIDIVNRAADDLKNLVAETGTTAMLSVLGNKGPTVIRWERSSANLHTNLGLGSVLPLCTSATGHSFLAFAPSRIVEPLAQREMSELPNPPDITVLRDTVRRRGYASVDQTFIPGLFASSAPILNWQGEAECVVTLIGVDTALIEPDGPHLNALLQFASTHSIGEP
ncbi:MAG: IclR family transcriptional regulator [Pseudomonadota bacterium]